MSGLNLIPNEVVGYRIRPDLHNWTIMLVKRRGPLSKRNGEEYGEEICYYRDLEKAVSSLFDFNMKRFTEEAQLAIQLETGELASLKALEVAIAKSKEETLTAVKELIARGNINPIKTDVGT